ncbi:hypothetical protein SpCBS45565_g03965 [Spizellomyces sp. 'palustris']|nr:hypothetical protein SpCBS45565_g03965 [Spizellomyces sp. 'palustris']
MSVYPTFEQPATRLHIALSTNNNPVPGICETHTYNHAVQVIFPSQSSTITEQMRKDDDAYFYYKASVPLSFFIQPDFVNNYIRKGGFTALRSNAKADIEDTFALLPSGRLVMSVKKDTYETLGLVGRPSKFGDKGNRYFIHIDLNQPAFKPKGKLYERIKWCFTHTLTDTYEFLMSFTDTATRLPSEISFPPNVKATRLYIDGVCQTHENIMVPQIGDIEFEDLLNDPNDPKGEIWRDHALNLFEWLGLLACGAARIKAGNKVDPFFSVYSAPESSKPDTIVSVRWTGYLTTHQILRIKDRVKDCMKTEGLPWAAILVWGFRDAPVSWREEDHGYFLGGENDYVLVFRGEQQCISYQAVGTYDGFCI